MFGKINLEALFSMLNKYLLNEHLRNIFNHAECLFRLCHVLEVCSKPCQTSKIERRKTFHPRCFTGF